MLYSRAPFAGQAQLVERGREVPGARRRGEPEAGVARNTFALMEPDGVDALRADVRAQMDGYARRCAAAPAPGDEARFEVSSRDIH